MVTLKYTIPSLQTSILSFETILNNHDIVLSLYNRFSDLNERYLREINEYKQHIANLEQKLVKLEEERDTLQLAARLIAQDKYCGNADSNSSRWQNVSRSKTKDRDFANRAQMPNTSDIHCHNRYELLSDERNYNGTHGPSNIDDPFQIQNSQIQNQSHLISISKQPLEKHNNETQHPLEDNNCQNSNNQQSGQSKLNMYNLQSRLADTSVNSADHNFTHSDVQSPEQCVVIIGDSIIKNIISQKLSRKKVHKFTYPRIICSIESDVQNIENVNISASHVIIHCGTNNRMFALIRLRNYALQCMRSFQMLMLVSRVLQ